MGKKLTTIVIADDLTGAAEMAGVAMRYGLRVKLTMTPSVGSAWNDVDVIVVATDMRSMPEAEAVKKTTTILETIASSFPNGGYRLFKKTDSALRGHIMAETKATLQRLTLKRAILIPQNPSKGRIILQGHYSIGGVPLHLTSFAHDPEFPAHSSSVTNVLIGSKSLEIDDSIKEDNDVETTIFVADATSSNDIDVQLRKTTGECLIGGGADCFEAFLKTSIQLEGDFLNTTKHTHQQGQIPQADLSCKPVETKGLLVVCGSTQSNAIDLPVEDIQMPEDVFHGGSPQSWIHTLKEAYSRREALIMRVGNYANAGGKYAERLKQTMAEATLEIVNVCQPKTLVIEGGATAFAIFSALQWADFTVEKELAPGIVCLKHTDADNHETRIILKPGSYPWLGLL
ncbi:MAG: four-carbon acid sugar kinase family protein [Prevotella sp.]|nr:four-carbon acid sugar kinase family protein [Prevotella sp.]